MAVKLRLTRVGSKKNPIYRVVAADSRAPRDGRFLEIVGRYNPQTDPSTIELDEVKVKDWLGKGAQPTEAVAKLIKIKDTLGMKRQIFFCSLGGFDTHTNETNTDPTQPNNAGAQGNLLTQFSQAARAFYDEMGAQGNSNSVTLFTVSDFGRTFQPSGSGAG